MQHGETAGLRGRPVNVVRLAVLGAALLAAVGAFFLMRSMSAAPQADPSAQTAQDDTKVQILVATKDLALGERITPEALAWRDWPRDGLNPAYVQQSAQPKALESFANTVVRAPLLAGEPVIAAKLVTADTRGVLPALLTPGMRATSFTVNPDTGVAGFVLPEDRVDIALTRMTTRGEGQAQVEVAVVSTVLENVRVLAIDQAFEAPANTKNVVGTTVTVELTPRDVERLELADRLGDISLSLRSYADMAGPAIARTDAEAMRQREPRSAQVSMGPPPEAPPVSSFPSDSVGVPATGRVTLYLGGRSSTSQTGGPM
jgi:pilus assembly protein CpaB